MKAPEAGTRTSHTRVMVILATGLLSRLSGVVLAADAPQWVRQAVAADDPAWQPESEALLLLRSVDCVYQPAAKSSKGDAAKERSAHMFDRGVVRIRTEEARQTVFAVLPYDPSMTHIVSATAWTISSRGERKVEVYRRRDFTDSVAVYDSQAWDYRRVLQFWSPDKVAAGDVLAWEFEFDFSSPFLENYFSLRDRWPVLGWDLNVSAAAGDALTFSTSRPDLLIPQPGLRPGALRWKVDRLIPAPARPPTAFYSNPFTIRVRLVAGEAASTPVTWENVSTQAAQLIETKMDASGADITALVAQKTKGLVNRWDRIRALSGFVQESITYLEIAANRDRLAGFRPHPPASVLHNRYGDCKDKATLLVSALRAIGEPAKVVLVDHGNPLAIDPHWPTTGFNHAIVIIKADGSEPVSWPRVGTADGARWIVFDPTDTDVPLGVLPLADGGGFGLIVADHGGELVRLPTPDAENNGARLKFNLALGADDVLHAQVSEDFCGTTAAQFHGIRRNRTAEQYLDYLESVVHRANPLTRELHWKDDWDPAGARYHVAIDYVVPAFGRRTPNGMLRVSPDVVPSDFRPPPWPETADGIVLLGPDTYDVESDLQVPDGYAVEHLPDGLKRSEGRLGAEITFESRGSEVIMRFRLRREPGTYDRAQYGALRAFYREMNETARSSIVLRPLAAKS